MPDCTQRKASSGVLSFFLYSISHNMSGDSPSHSITVKLRGTHALVSHRGVVQGGIKKFVEQFEHLQLAKRFRRPAEHRLALEERPQIFFGQDDGHGQLAERHQLLRAASADLEITL